MKNNQKGITLIALVITIVILLILAGISISGLSDNGLFGKAQDAEKKYENAQAEENKTLLGYESNIDEYVTGVKKLTDTENTKPSQAMPEGARVIENDASKGIVIADKNGNEWTWVVVPKTTVFTTATSASDYDNIKADLINYATDYREGKTGQGYSWTDEWYDYCGTTYDGKNQYSQVKYIRSSSYFTKAKNYYGTIYTDTGTTEATEYVSGTTYYADITQKLTDTSGCGLSYEKYKENYEKILSRVYENGGFWISRYEIGDTTSTESNTTRTSDSGITGTAVSKPNQMPYTYVTCSQAQTLASGMSTDTNQTSSLLFGIQWDLTCKFIEENSELELVDINSDSTSWGDYKNISLTLNRGKYNTNPGSSTSVWTQYETETDNYVTKEQKLKDVAVLITTGAAEKTNKMNIYDFAGNVNEWTLERSPNPFPMCPCANRGGAYSNPGGYYSPASSRWQNLSDAGNYLIGFRATLY